MKTISLLIIGLGAVALIFGLNLRHAFNDYGIIKNNLAYQIVAQTNSSGGDTSGGGSTSGGNTGGETGGETGGDTSFPDLSVPKCPGGSCTGVLPTGQPCSACCPKEKDPLCDIWGCTCKLR